MSEPQYTRTQLMELLKLATKLGYWDDVAHWKHLLAEKEKS